MEKRFTVIDNEYVNTGGHCMVDITTVYDTQQKNLLYMMVGMDWMTLSTYDYVQNETPSGKDAEDFILYSMEIRDFSTDPCWDNTSMVDMPEEYFDLFNHGMLSHIRNKYKCDHQLTKTTYNNLPVELSCMVDDDYAAWLSQEGLLVTTDGEKIIVDDRYDQLFYDSNGVAAVEFKQLLEKMRADADIDDDHLAIFEDEYIHLVINGKVFTLGMCAAVWNGLIEYADYIISEQ